MRKSTEAPVRLQKVTVKNLETVQVSAGKGYPVLVEPGLLAGSGVHIRALTTSKRIAIVTDDIVAALYLDPLKTSLAQARFEAVSTFVLPNGEHSKTLASVERLYNFLNDSHITRTDLVLALGGGVVGDVTGFAAATYLRGIRYVQIPTTLLAQVDSSVGGKTGVNLPFGKNLVGAFWQPSLVLCDPALLASLRKETFEDGMAEVIKYGAIRDTALFDMICRTDYKQHLSEVIHRCISIKRDIVEVDELDTGERMLLNFGHTLGHAIERESSYAVSHGSAVAIGMVLITTASEKAGITPCGITEKLRHACLLHGLPIATALDYSALVSHCMNDKKREDCDINIILLKQIGEAYLHKMPAAGFENLILGGST